jgi:hypothetical protein
MKQMLVMATLCCTALMLAYCGGSKKAQVAAKPAPVTFEGNVKPIVMATCSPCHTPGNGRLPSYLTAENTQKDIDDIVHRISLQPNERGFMPMRHARLSDSSINVFKQWKTDGFVAKAM